MLLLRGYLLDRVDAQLLAASAPRRRRSASVRSLRATAGRRPARRAARASSSSRSCDSSGAVVSSNTGSLRRIRVGTRSRAASPRPTVTELGGQPTTVAAAGGGAGYRVVATSTADGGSVVLAVVARAASKRPRIATWPSVAIVDLARAARAASAWPYVVVRVGLRPLDEVEATADQIAAGDLDRRVPEGPPGTEVGRLSRALNAMLEQISPAFAAREASENRLRRFIADASHELRTPLTSIRGYAEL